MKTKKKSSKVLPVSQPVRSQRATLREIFFQKIEFSGIFCHNTVNVQLLALILSFP